MRMCYCFPGSFLSGTLTLPDVSSADGSGMSWLQGSSVSLSKAPSPLFKPGTLAYPSDPLVSLHSALPAS